MNLRGETVVFGTMSESTSRNNEKLNLLIRKIKNSFGYDNSMAYETAENYLNALKENGFSYDAAIDQAIIDFSTPKEKSLMVPLIIIASITFGTLEFLK